MSFGAVAVFWKHDLKINTCIFKTNIRPQGHKTKMSSL